MSITNRFSNDSFAQARDFFILGLENYHNGLFEESEKYFYLSLNILPGRLSTLTNLSAVLIQLDKLEKARDILNNAISLFPNDPSLYLMQGQLFEKNKGFQNAITNYKHAVTINVNYTEAYFCLANALAQINYLEDSLTNYDIVIKLNPNFLDAHKNREKIFQDLVRSEELTQSGLLLAQKKNYDKAHNYLSDAVNIDAKNIFALLSLGFVLSELNQLNDALDCFNTAINFKPDYSEAHFNRGLVLTKLNRNIEALEGYENAIIFKPDFAEAYLNQGNLLKELHFFDRALQSYNKAVDINPEYAEAFYNRGLLLKVLKRFTDALESFDKAIKINPDFWEAYSDRGIVLTKLKQLNYALDSYDRAILIKSDYAEAYFNRAQVYLELMDFNKALESYNKTFVINPNHEYLLGTLLYTKLLICDWKEFDNFELELRTQIYNEKKVSICFPVLSAIDSPLIQFENSKRWINDKYPLSSLLNSISYTKHSGKIKVGYYSGDFREHPVAYLTAELFELHDRSKFEVIAFSFGSSNYSEFCKRVSSAFCRFIDITKLSDKDVALLSRDIGIDIAIDLTGHTTNERVGIFSYRAAPIQLSYLGYLGTMGAQYYDYLLADKIIIPPPNQQYYCEKIVYLPSYQVNDSKRKIADKAFTRAELNLPESGFVFCCFNNNYKITPSTFAGWMRILTAVPDSVLFLFADNKWAEENLKIEAENRGVCQTRLVFGARINRSEYLARYRVADLFLDTLPYNAGTTASDALWAGLPVLTCMGESFASRVAASLLNAIELTELITNSQHQYEATAIELATNPTKLKAVKDKLQRNRLTTALFDTKLFTKNIEAAYTEMYKRYQNNSPPEHIYH